MHRTITTWADFHTAWGGVHNFLMSGECVPFAFDVPPLDRVVDEMRQHPEARIGSGVKADTLTMDDTSEAFRKLPIEKALDSSFSLSHFRLGVFDAPGKFLHGFKQQVVDPWENALRAAGFTWTRCYPIIFISGKGCATNYHMDFSHVLAWQVYGHKKFCGLKEPQKWAPREARVRYSFKDIRRPPELTEADALCYEMAPGDVLWNAMLTPHWVDAGDGVAMSFNLSHGGIRLNGELCQHERELMEHIAANPVGAPSLPEGGY